MSSLGLGRFAGSAYVALFFRTAGLEVGALGSSVGEGVLCSVEIMVEVASEICEEMVDSAVVTEEVMWEMTDE